TCPASLSRSNGDSTSPSPTPSRTRRPRSQSLCNDHTGTAVTEVPRRPGQPPHANSSNNWFGYNQGTLEQGSKLCNSVSGDWTVPTATQHTAGQAESSSDWIGIGGGCIDSGCTATDPTLIQTGTEQDVSASGSATYS